MSSRTGHPNTAHSLEQSLLGGSGLCRTSLEQSLKGGSGCVFAVTQLHILDSLDSLDMLDRIGSDWSGTI